MIILFILLPGVLGLYEDCDHHQELQPKNTYYFNSPRHPAQQKSGTSCRWYAVSPPGTKVLLTCKDNKKYRRPSCSSETILVSRSGALDFNDAQAYRTTGGFTTVSSGNKMNVAFLSKRSSWDSSLRCNMRVDESSIETTKSNCECGRRNGQRIVGGEETGIDEFPMMAGLVDLEIREIFCGATIISPNYALTAASCANKDPDSIGLVVGEHDVSTGSETNSTKLQVIDKFIIHPEYNSETQANDIALVRVKTSITFNMRVGPACLPFSNSKETFAGESVTALGWGLLDFGGASSNTLQKVDLNVITLKECKRTYGSSVTERQLCTYKENKDACQRDTGGPLLWEDPKDQRLKVLGVINIFQCATEEPSVSTRVTEYLSWITENSGNEYCAE